MSTQYSTQTMYHTSADSLTTGPCLPQGWKVCSWSQHMCTLPQTCRVHTTCYNKQHTYTQHMHRTQMICTSYHHQQPSSTLSIGGSRRGKWTVDVNPVNSEQHMHYIHLVIKEQHCSGECLLRCLLLPVWEDCLLSVACLSCYISVYICY